MTTYAIEGSVVTPWLGSTELQGWRKTSFIVNIHLPANLLDLAPGSSLVVDLRYDTKESTGGKDEVRWRYPFYETFVLSRSGKQQLTKRFKLRPEALSVTNLLTVTHLFECDTSTIEGWRTRRTTGFELRWYLEDEGGRERVRINYTTAEWEKDKSFCFGSSKCTVMQRQGFLNLVKVMHCHHLCQWFWLKGAE